NPLATVMGVVNEETGICLIRWQVVREPLNGYLLEDLPAQGSASVQTWRMDDEDERIAAEIVTAWEAVLNAAEDPYQSGTWVQLAWSQRDRRYYVVAANCDPEEDENLPVPEDLILDGGDSSSSPSLTYDGGTSDSEPFLILDGG